MKKLVIVACLLFSTAMFAATKPGHEAYAKRASFALGKKALKGVAYVGRKAERGVVRTAKFLF